MQLTVKEVAELKGCCIQSVHNQISKGKLPATVNINPENKRKQYMVDLSDLPPALQRKYYTRRQAEQPLPALAAEKLAREKSFDEYSETERQQITFWSRIIEDWLTARQGFDRATDADELYVASLKLKYRELNVSVRTLYDKYAAYKAGDLTGLTDRRGGANRGKSSIPEPVWNYFLCAYLDDRKLPLTQCYEMCKQWTAEYSPELVSSIPSERTFRRQADKLEEPVVTLARDGEKAYNDRCGIYVVREYEELHANDYWIADNHTLDVMSRASDGSDTVHRLSLTAFLDARSGVMVGWNLTDNPCSQSTLLALRHGIMRFGIPKKIYVDNGREFLTRDIGGLGHRRKKSTSLIDDPPPVFARLGIEMTNAIVRNARAKPIERTFNTFKGTVSRCFETFTGGNILEKPESLKATLKRGNIPMDSTLREVVADMLDGIYNVGAYGGRVKADRGKRRIDVWNESVAEVGKRVAPPDELALMLMRSSRVQKVSRNGVYITVCGEKLYYRDEELHLEQGKEVYVRYDPEHLETVRLYEAATDKYIRTLPMAVETMLMFDDTPDNVAKAQETIRAAKKAVHGRLKEYRTRLPAAQRIDILDMQIRRAHAGKADFCIQEPNIIIPISAGEQPLKKAAGSNIESVVMDFEAMNRTAEKKRYGK